MQSHPTKKPFKPNPQQRQPHRQGQKQQIPKSQASFDTNICKCCGGTRHRPGFNCLASKFRYKKCQKYEHFTSKYLTKPQSTNVNTIEEVNAVLAFTKPPHSVQAELLDDSSLDAMYSKHIQAKRHVFADLQLATQSSKPKYLKVRLDTAPDVSMMSKSVYQQLFDDPQCQKLQPVTTNTVMHDHSKAEVLGSVTIPILKDNKKHGITFQVVPHEASTLLSCEQVTKHGLAIIPEQKQTPKNATVHGSSVDIKYINFSRGTTLRLPPGILHPNSLSHL